jgi:hypothetical protein
MFSKALYSQEIAGALYVAPGCLVVSFLDVLPEPLAFIPEQDV